MSREVNPADWLVWHKVATELPYSSTLTIYPPVMLYAENGGLRGSISAPYFLSGNNNRVSNDFLITVTDARGRIHFLEPKMESVGFVNETGISMSSLSSDSFENGKIQIQLYKTNSEENRQKLSDRNKRDIARQQGIEKALSRIRIPKPILGEIWPIEALTLKEQSIDEIVSSSKFTIVQLYSEFCGFCRKVIPFNNSLNVYENINVIGIAGTNNFNAFKRHLDTNELEYSFIAYEDDYAEPALLEATGQQGFPTYFVLDAAKQVLGIFVGTPSLESWLAAQAI
jgi:thiol-disulfide isomerase/thioredoxin